MNWGALVDQAAAGFDPVPDGQYHVEVVESKAGASSTQKTMFSVKFNVVAGPHVNRKIWNNFTVSPENPNALGFFFKHMAALGLDRAFFQANPAPESIANAMVGRRARVNVGTREWPEGSGTYRNDVNDVLPPDDQTLAAVPTAAANGAPQPGGQPMPQPGFAPQPGQPMPQPQVAPQPQAQPPVQMPTPQPAQPQYAPQTAPVAQPQPAPQPAPQAQPVPQPQAAPAPQPQAAPAPQPQPAPAPAPAAQPQAAPAPQPQAAPQPAPAAPQPVPSPEAQAPVPQPAADPSTPQPPAPVDGTPQPPMPPF